MEKRWKMSELKSLDCIRCGKNLLLPESSGKGNIIFVYEWPKDGPTKYLKIYYVCKSCDSPPRTATKEVTGREDVMDGWKDISDFRIPEMFSQWIIGIMAGLHEGHDVYTDAAMKELMRFILIMFLDIERKVKLSQEQKKTLKGLHGMPRWIGGLA